MRKKVKHHYKEIEITRACHVDFGDFPDCEIVHRQVNYVQLKCNIMYDTMRFNLPTKLQCESLEECILTIGKDEFDRQVNIFFHYFRFVLCKYYINCLLLQLMDKTL